MKTPSQSHSGSVFVIALITLTVVATIIGVSATLTSHVGRLSARNNNKAEAQTAAESAIEVLFNNWRTLTSANLNPTNTMLSASSVVPTASQWVVLHPGLAGYTITSSLQALDNNGVPVSGGNGTASARWTFSSGPTTRRIRQRSYLATATVVRAGQRAIVQRVFERNDNPFFSYMMFAQEKFELHPGPNMDVVGKIHCNEGTMYLLGGVGNTLRLWDYVSYVDGYAEAGSPELIANEGVSGRTLPVYGATGTTSATEKARLLSQTDPLEAFGRDTSLIFDSSNINAQSYREIIERPNSSDPTVQDIEDRRLYNQADLKILINRSLITQPDKPITDAANVAAVQVLNKSDNAVSGTVKTAVLKGISTTTTSGSTTAATKFYDARESRFVEAVNVDIGTLKTEFYDKSGTGFYAPILYVSEINRPTVNQGQGYDANGNAISTTSSVYNTVGGVRIKNARELPKNVNPDGDSDGLVIVSENPIYVQGDFNTGGVVAADVATNRSIGSTVIPTNDRYNGTTLAANSTQRYSRVPSAIMGDAVTILSNAWNDANSFYNKTRWDSTKKLLIIDGPTGLTSTSTTVDVYSATGVKTTQTITRNGAKSTVNAAVFSGWMVSDSSQRTGSPNDRQSGGLHNFPRFLENWGDSTSFTYYGSLVTLFESEQGYADFGTSGYYNPPRRVWYYDPLFETQQPAGFFASTEYRRGRFYRTLANN